MLGSRKLQSAVASAAFCQGERYETNHRACWSGLVTDCDCRAGIGGAASPTALLRRKPSGPADQSGRGWILQCNVVEREGVWLDLFRRELLLRSGPRRYRRTESGCRAERADEQCLGVIH